MLKKVESAKEKKWKRVTGGDVGIPPGTEYDLLQLKGAKKAGGREKHPIKVAVDQHKARKKEGG